MRKRLLKSMDRNAELDMVYLAKDGKVIQVGEESFRAYCYLRKSKRTFRIDNVLALVPVIKRERDLV